MRPAPRKLHSICTRLLSMASVPLIAATSPSMAAADVPDAFVALPQFSSAHISPDGKHLAVLAPYPRQDMVVVFDLDKMEVVGNFATAEGAVLDQLWWASNERMVFSTASFTGRPNSGMPASDLFASNIDGSDLMALAGSPVGEFSFNQVLNPLPDDSGHVLLGKVGGIPGPGMDMTPRAIRADINRAPRQARQMTRSTPRSSGPSGVANPFERGAFVARPDGELALAYQAGPQGMEIRVAGPRGRWDQPDASVQSAFADMQTVLRVAPDNQHVFALGAGDNGRQALYKIDLNSGEKNRLFAHESYDVQENDVVWASDGEAIGVKFVRSLPEINYFSEHAEVALHQQLDEAFPGYLVKALNYSEDGSRMVAVVTSDFAPAALYMLDRAQGEFRMITNAYPGLSPENMALVEPFVVQNRDGLTLEGYLTRPAGAEDGEGALIVIPRDDPYGSANDFLFDIESQLLANAGYSVLQVNYRGTPGYGQTFSTAGMDQWDSGIITDIIDATLWATSAGITEEKVCLYGRGYGAYAAIMAAAQAPEMFDCVVGYGGFYDLSLMAPPEPEGGRRGPFGGGGAAPGPQTANSFVGALMAVDGERRQRGSALNVAGQLQAPVLLVHGEDDAVAPVAHARNFSQALESQGKQAELWVADKEVHGFADEAQRKAFYERLTAFFDQHLQ